MLKDTFLVIILMVNVTGDKNNKYFVVKVFIAVISLPFYPPIIFPISCGKNILIKPDLNILS